MTEHFKPDINIDGPGVISVSSDDVVKTENGIRQVAALKRMIENKDAKMTKKTETSADLLKRMRDMELHESMNVVNGLEVLRVPGGWNYNYLSISGELYIVFVALCNDFKPK